MIRKTLTIAFACSLAIIGNIAMAKPFPSEDHNGWRLVNILPNGHFDVEVHRDTFSYQGGVASFWLRSIYRGNSAYTPQHAFFSVKCDTNQYRRTAIVFSDLHPRFLGGGGGERAAEFWRTGQRLGEIQRDWQEIRRDEPSEYNAQLVCEHFRKGIMAFRD